MKKIKKTSLIAMLIFTGIATQSANALKHKDLIKLFSHKKEEFAKKKLFEEPSNEYGTAGQVAKWGSALVGAIPALYEIYNLSFGDGEKDDNYSIAESIAIYGIIAVLPFITYKLGNEFISKPINFLENRKQAFNNVVANWGTLREYFPDALHEYFDSLHGQYSLGEITAKQLDERAPEALETLKSILHKEKSLNKITFFKWLIASSMLATIVLPTFTMLNETSKD